MTPKIKAVLMEARDMDRALTRIAHEILERNKGIQDLVLIGIKARGDVLAERLAIKIKNIEGTEIPYGAMDITFYRDDAGIHKPEKAPSPTELPFDVNKKKVILVDDVLYTGRSARAAIDQIIDFGRPTFIQYAVLVDRGHREFPIHADYVGKNIPSSSREKVLVHVKENDGKDEVAIAEVES
ncbi:MAG TPA: bifunctional pyr operon transcriptional regulator/uracil phosphoribosyltransferase PyrR [bacterium]|nr:bifunctional pyr operon transcriptional regulator/uracil phosphoribosyltransferase PyrR [bacterium]